MPESSLILSDNVRVASALGLASMQQRRSRVIGAGISETAELADVLSTTLRSEPSAPRLPRAPVQPESVNTTIAAEPSPDRTADTRQRVVASFKTLESWVCRVDEVDRESNRFTATVASGVFRGTEELAEFAFDELSVDDLPLLQPGAIFYWSVGYRIDQFGRRSTSSEIRFRRLTHWTRKELEAAAVRARAYTDWFIGSDAP